jgi:hypothetical protein
VSFLKQVSATYSGPTPKDYHKVTIVFLSQVQLLSEVQPILEVVGT